MADERRYTNGDAVDIIDNEGIGYAVCHYTSGDAFEDELTRHLWNSAAASLDALALYLERQTRREING